MNILITGSDGFIGKHLLDYFKKGNKVYSLLYGLEYLFEGNKIHINLLNDSHMESLISENLSIDVIIHAASILGSSSDIYDLSILYNNIKMYENINKLIEFYKPDKIINFSSIAVYPTLEGEYSEESHIKPSVNSEGIYGLSKFCGENILDFCNKNNGTDIINLRLSQVYGEGMRNDRILKIMENELKEKNTVTVFGNGKRVSSFIEINELIKIVDLCVNKKISGVYNTGGHNWSYLELAEQVIEKYGNKDSRVILEDKGISAKCFINSAKIEEWKEI